MIDVVAIDQETRNSGDGSLGTLALQLADSVTDSAEVAIIEVNFLRVDGAADRRLVRSIATITPEPSEPELPGDFDENGNVDFFDFLMFVDGFNTAEGDPNFEALFDLDGSGTVDFFDLFIFADNFGKRA